MARTTLAERFWAKVATGGPAQCWLWSGARTRGGYGSVRGSDGVTYAHRVAYELAHGAVPDGLVIDHTCHNADETCPGGPTCVHRRCVNPAHLRAVPHQANVDGGRRSAHETCSRGHSMDDAYERPDGNGRMCRTCQQEREKARPRRPYDPAARRAAYERKKAST